jgi:lipopolysaccharide/colanic/teichoic acid biosynthesis glycosyltransferase
VPQVINVLKGDMSFVGPRPERPHFVDRLKKLIPNYEKRNIVKPGISGWAQVNVPFNTPDINAYEKQTHMHNLFFVQNVSIRLYFKVFWLSMKRALKDF